MKNKRFTNSLIVIVFAIVALVVVGCKDNKINGGGYILKTNGQKVNFGFNFKCKCGDSVDVYGIPDVSEVSGQLQFNDHEKGVRFHGVADSVPDICSQNEWMGEYCGSYTPQPRKLGKGGRFSLYLEDKGEPGYSKGDFFRLKLTDGIWADYSIAGFLAGGNIQALGAKINEDE